MLHLLKLIKVLVYIEKHHYSYKMYTEVIITVKGDERQIGDKW